MTISLLNIGDELLNGQVVNTNCTWLGEQISARGLSVLRAISVGDESGEIQWALRELLRVSDVVICTGGLGSTPDDVTRHAIAEALKRPLEVRPDVVEEIRLFYEQRGRNVPAAGGLMAEAPTGFEVLRNPVGVAPGLWYSGEVPPVGERIVVALPGIPREMEVLMREVVLPRLARQRGEAVVVQKTLLTVGLGESAIAERLGHPAQLLQDGVRMAFLPNYGEVRLRLTSRGRSAAEARQRLEITEHLVRERLGDLIFAEGEIPLAEAVGRLLRERGLTLALAESCTGGSVASAITDVPGSSDYFRGGVVVYSNQSKVDLLAADPGVFQREGAVSEAMALQIAAGVRTRLHADIGVGITGVAGPGGGTPKTPVGTVWLGYADATTGRAVRLQLGGDRITIKRLTVTAALNLIRGNLLRAEVTATSGV